MPGPSRIEVGMSGLDSATLPLVPLPQPKWDYILKVQHLFFQQDCRDGALLLRARLDHGDDGHDAAG